MLRCTYDMRTVGGLGHFFIISRNSSHWSPSNSGSHNTTIQFGFGMEVHVIHRSDRTVLSCADFHCLCGHNPLMLQTDRQTDGCRTCIYTHVALKKLKIRLFIPEGSVISFFLKFLTRYSLSDVIYYCFILCAIAHNHYRKLCWFR